MFRASHMYIKNQVFRSFDLVFGLIRDELDMADPYPNAISIQTCRELELEHLQMTYKSWEMAAKPSPQVPTRAFQSSA